MSQAFASDEEDVVDDGQTSRAPRDSFFFQASARLSGDDTEISLRVRNLSIGGMMADCDRPCARGDELLVELRGIGIVRGRIAWRANGRIGVAFDEPIDPQLARRPVAAIARQDKTAATIEQMRRPAVRTRW